MRYLTNNSTDPYFNLAFDEYCLENVISEEPYFFLWRNRPSVIIGLNQNAYSEVNLPYLESHGITLARRVTGGGAVYHDLQNLNYTIIGRRTDESRSLSALPRSLSALPRPQSGAEGWFDSAHQPSPIVNALHRLGVPAELTGRNDIFVEGRKVSGYARRVSRNQEIIHGTLMYDVDIDTLTNVLDAPGSKMQAKGIGSVRSRVANLKDYLPGFKSLDEVQAALQEILSDGDGPMDFPEDGLDRVREMRDGKFSTWEFIYGHSHEADLVRKAKLPCGTVEAAICLDRGVIKDLAFSGDYIFDEPVDGLAEALTGCRFERFAVAEALGSVQVSSFFRDCSATDMLDLLF